MKDDEYHLHQTPPELCLRLIDFVPITFGDTVFEPFRGEGAFYNAIRKKTQNVSWAEIEEGIDYRDISGQFDWVVTNPPFKIDGRPSFGRLLMELSSQCKKGFAYLGNDYCLTGLTTSRLHKLEEKGLYLHKIVICNVKKWRGRYYFVIFTRDKNPAFEYLRESF